MDPTLDIPTPNDPTPFTQAAQSEGDKTLLVKFFVKPRPDHDASAQQGRPVFRDVEYIDIKVPGSRAGACRPATARDKARFPDHYAAFKQRQEMPDEGTPLIEWPPMSRSMVEQLAFYNVKTVEQLAAMSDAATQNMMGLSRFKQLAQQYLSAAEADAPLAKMQAELDARDHRIAVQEDTIAKLSARLTALEAAQSGQETSPSEGVHVEPSAAIGPQEGAQEPVSPVGGYKSVLDAAPDAAEGAEATEATEGDGATEPAGDDGEKPARGRRSRRQPV